MSADSKSKQSTNDKDKSNKGTSTNNKGKRGKSAVTKKLDVLKKILNNGAKEHKDAIDRIIKEYQDYCDYEKLQVQFDDLKARLETTKIIKENEAERKAAEEAEKLKPSKAKKFKADEVE